MHLGIDVGGTNLKAGLVDDQGKLVQVCRTPLNFCGAEAFVDALGELALRTVRESGVDPASVETVGMGIPGAVSEGRIIYTSNIPLQDVPVEKWFRRYLDVPVFLGNDADCAAVGEYFHGAGRGSRDFVVVTLGTGVGGGLVIGGKLQTGLGMGGEVGHMVIVHDGELCNCGRKGCWERYASATALIRLTKEAMEQHPDSRMHAVAAELGGVDGRTSFTAAEQGDPAALDVCSRYVSYLAAGVTNLVNMLQPEKLALGGGVADAPAALLLDPLRRTVAEECIGRHAGVYTEIVKAELGNDAGIIGAAMLHRAVR